MRAFKRHPDISRHNALQQQRHSPRLASFAGQNRASADRIIPHPRAIPDRRLQDQIHPWSKTEPSGHVGPGSQLVLAHSESWKKAEENPLAGPVSQPNMLSSEKPPCTCWGTCTNGKGCVGHALMSTTPLLGHPCHNVYHSHTRLSMWTHTSTHPSYWTHPSMQHKIMQSSLDQDPQAVNWCSAATFEEGCCISWMTHGADDKTKDDHRQTTHNKGRDTAHLGYGSSTDHSIRTYQHVPVLLLMLGICSTTQQCTHKANTYVSTSFPWHLLATVHARVQHSSVLDLFRPVFIAANDMK